MMIQKEQKEAITEGRSQQCFGVTFMKESASQEVTMSFEPQFLKQLRFLKRQNKQHVHQRMVHMNFKTLETHLLWHNSGADKCMSKRLLSWVHLPGDSVGDENHVFQYLYDMYLLDKRIPMVNSFAQGHKPFVSFQINM